MKNLKAFEKKIGVQFQDYSLLSRALTHRSYLNENPGASLDDNERLEFLGDAVLDFVVGAYLYHRFPEKTEGDLTSFRAALVRTRTLAQFAKQWEIGEHLLLGYGETENGGRTRSPILCAAFEAVIGAIYLDKGLTKVQQLLEPLIDPALNKIMEQSLHKDPKSEFQMWAQAKYNVTPRYKVVDTSGPDHAKTFTVQVMLKDDIWGEGSGRSKQMAQQAAARVAVQKAEAIDVETEAAVVEATENGTEFVDSRMLMRDGDESG